MTSSKKREYNIITGIEDPEESNKRIRTYVGKEFKHKPETFFLEWDKRRIIIENCEKWAFPEPVMKVGIFLNYTTSKPKNDIKSKKRASIPSCDNTIYEDMDEIDLNNDFLYCEGIKNVRILIDTIHSAHDQFKSYCLKKSKTNNKRDNRYYLLMSIHNHKSTQPLPDSHIADLLKAFNREKIRTSFDQRLRNLLEFVVNSIKNNEKKYQIAVRKDVFFNKNIKDTILPESYAYLAPAYEVIYKDQ